MPIVRMPTGELVDLPDEMTPQQEAQLRLMTSPAALPKEAAAEGSTYQLGKPDLPEFGRRAGLLTRAGATGVMGSVTTLADVLNWANNKATGQQAPRPSEQFQDTLTHAGLPLPQSPEDQGMSVLANVATGVVADPVNLLTKGMSLSRNAPAMAERAKTLQDAKDLGMRLSPSEAGGSLAGRVLEGLTGSGTLAQRLKQKNIAVSDAALHRAADLPEVATLNRETLGRAIDSTYNSTYKPIEALGQLPTGVQYQRDLDAVLANYTNKSFPDARPPGDISNLVDSYRVGGFDAADAVDRIKKLREGASTAFRNGNDDLGRAHRSIADALEGNIGLNLQLGGQGDLLSSFKSGREQLARQYAVRDALIEGSGSGDIGQLAKGLQQHGKPYTGELDTLARFANTAPKMVGKPMGDALPVNRWEGAVALGSALGTPFNPALAAGMAYPAAAVGVRELLASPVGQALFSRVRQPGGGMPFPLKAAPSIYNLGSGLLGADQQ